MNIGFDASRINISQRTGTENYSFYLARALAGVDKANWYTLYFRKPPSFEEFKRISSGNPHFKSSVISCPLLWTQAGLAWECWKRPLDLLFVPAHTLPVIRRPSLKSVVTIHDLGFEYLPEYHQFPQKLYLDKSTVFAAYHATHLIAVSEATKQDLVRRFNIPEDKITVVYEGVDKNRFKVQNPKFKVREVRRKYGIRGEYILFVGTVQPRKNLRRLIEAFAGVTHRVNDSSPNLQLVVVGKPGWLFEGIYSAPREFGVEDKVCFLGHVPDDYLPALYLGATCFALPSLFEGFGLPVLEAMAAGVPVVTSNTSSLPEVAGPAAVYVDPYCISCIAEGLLEVLEGSKRFRDSLVEKGWKQVGKFSWKRVAEETLRVFEEVVLREM